MVDGVTGEFHCHWFDHNFLRGFQKSLTVVFGASEYK